MCYNCLTRKKEENKDMQDLDKVQKGLAIACSYHGIINCCLYGERKKCTTKGCSSYYHDFCRSTSKMLHPDSHWSELQLCGICFHAKFIEPTVISALNCNYRKLLINESTQPMSLRVTNHSVPFRMQPCRGQAKLNVNNVMYVLAQMIHYIVQDSEMPRNAVERKIEKELDAEKGNTEASSANPMVKHDDTPLAKKRKQNKSKKEKGKFKKHFWASFRMPKLSF